MKLSLVSIVISAIAVADKVQSADDEVVSLLQHSARPIRKVDDSVEVAAAAAAPPTGTQERIRARRDARALKRASGDVTATPAQVEARRARRRAKRQARREGHVAGQRHFNDGGACDTCATVCEELFQDTFKACMISEDCQPWQKEDGDTSDKCKRRCDRVGNWKREPCNRLCECDGSVIEAPPAALAQTKTQWVNGIHRCRDAEVGMISGCTTVAVEPGSFAFDSIGKCARAAVDSAADTFNFYRTSKQFGKCTLKKCGTANLLLERAPAETDTPAGRGNWKVFSTYCDAPAEADRSNSGQDESSR